ncbi:MAG TPA: GTP-binding protein [Candidatus Omnitrophota bacterium]|nr:GTP-binding protein [Candidatus Omnitrophota bacterium]
MENLIDKAKKLFGGETMNIDLMPKMNIVVVGHVDHGKSTLVGRLLADTDSLPQGKLDQVKADCQRNAKPFEYAFLLDALKDERAQGITIDTARCFFKSKKRQYIIIDAPGHIEFLKNMVSGAARAEAALLLIDAKEGIRENSKRHGYLLSMLGIKQITVCVNKMDLVSYSEEVFNQIEKDYRAFLQQIGVVPEQFIPIAAFHGDNMVLKSDKMPWYKGPSILEMLDQFKKAQPPENQVFRMPVQSIYKFTADGDDRRIIAGKVETGKISAGDDVIFLPSNKRCKVKTIEGFNIPAQKSVAAGHSTGVTLTEELYLQRGDIMCKLDETLPQVSSLLQVKLFWMNKRPLVMGKEYKLKIGTAKVSVYVKKINHVLDASNLNSAQKTQVERHDVAELVLETKTPVAFDLTGDIEATGRFVIVDEYDISGGGIITSMIRDEQADVRDQVVLREQKWDFSIVDRGARAKKYGHQPKFILLTGKVGVDKKTIAKEIEKDLFESGCKTYFLGIGNLLRGLDVDLDKKARGEHIRRMGEVAHIWMDAGLIVVATASNLNDEELRMLQEVVSRDQVMIVNVGKNEFRQGLVDVQLEANAPAAESVKKIRALLTEQKVFAV